MEDFNDIDAIGPYRTDEEAQDAFRHISENPLLEKKIGRASCRERV